MLKTEYKLVCDHCAVEIEVGAKAITVIEGIFLGIFNTVNDADDIKDRKDWHYHPLCYDEYTTRMGFPNPEYRSEIFKNDDS